MLNLHTFKKQLLRCFDGNVPDTLMVALSGGVDSMCLTFLLSQFKKLHHPSLSIHAITIDHGYRPGSGEEAQNVGELVQKWGVSHEVVKLNYNQDLESITNFEEVARTMRYSVFRDEGRRLGVRSLLVGHTLDDRIETMLQRLQMNSTIFGLDGLKPKAGIPLPQDSPYANVSLVRPLLQFQKSELMGFCKAHGVSWHEDHTNSDKWLTKRNMLRYMVNEYVPQQRPDCVELTKPELIKSLSMLDDSIEMLELKITALDEYLHEFEDLNLDAKTGKISFSIPQSMWEKTHEMVKSRWIYRVMCQISSSKNLHWSYAKIERLAIPRILLFVTAKDNRLTLTYINVKIEVEKIEGKLKFALSKQSPIRSETEEISCVLHIENGISTWVFYDQTWWVRIKHDEDCKVTVLPYTLQMKQKLKTAFPELTKLPPGNSTIPVVVNTQGNIVALPTYGLVCENYGVECTIKSATRE